MDSRKIVFRETGIIVVGEVILSAVMVAVFAALGYFQMNVLWGALAGCLVTTVNYFFLALVVCLASDRAAAGEVTQAQKMIQMSAVTRLLATGALLAVAILLGGNVIATVIPLLFLRPIMLVAEFFKKKDGAE